MKICMAGIDYNTASLDDRERFAPTKAAQAKLLEKALRYPGVSGCVVISTCNRMELWLSRGEEDVARPFDILCAQFGVDAAAHEKYFTQREDDDAVRHLFEVTSGLKSRIFGEEQILAQVKEAIVFSRENKAADPVLEALFRGAVTAAKKAKTSVHLQAVDRSAPKTAVQILKSRFSGLDGLRCLVIGSGEMGLLSARTLAAEGCAVTITQRRHILSGGVVPAGCAVIDYEDRYKFFESAQVVVSATRSPHYTLACDQVSGLLAGQEKLLFDLAVPRDIDPKIAGLPGITLYDIDHLGGDLTALDDNESVRRVKEIIDGEIREFERWRSIRAMMPMVSELGARAAADTEERVRYSLKNVPLDDNTRKLVCEAAGKAAGKAVQSVLLRFDRDTGGGLLSRGLTEFKGDRRPAGGEDAAVKLPPRFPLFVDLSGKKIAVIGAGPIALRRITALSAYPCTICVTAPEAREEIRRLHHDNRIVYIEKAYEPGDLEDAYLVVAATNDRALNHQIALDAGRNGQFCSVADCREECTFYFPATIRYEGGVIGICGTGDDHGRTRDMAADIREFVKARERR
ncbi:glutamyl-tRNA reductase [Sporobacter termitidis DSM 10068]|uniref:Glutamyl-tRNA reductase n=1 Tax=Sporobacter termitidis DSM 10068 TaxID=1123282 RepID=A0A1M5XJB7_9FIRM|nr:glutamyl-tRNA reductase [Sporobacter termitidis]SHH99927.1 glutamyl-tRNA reductase [Sporobacter termitidis DSM 10068]